MAHEVHPDWEFNFGTIPLPNAVAIPISRAKVRKDRDGSPSGTRSLWGRRIVFSRRVMMPVCRNEFLKFLFVVSMWSSWGL